MRVLDNHNYTRYDVIELERPMLAGLGVELQEEMRRYTGLLNDLFGLKLTMHEYRTYY